MYSFKNRKRAAKGIKKSIVKNELTHDDYRRCLFDNNAENVKMTFIRSTKHQLYTIKQSKIGLSRYDDKRFIALDGINTKAHGHYSLIDASDDDGDDDDDDDDAAINTEDDGEDVSIISDRGEFDDDIDGDIDDNTMVLECSKFDDINDPQFNDSDNEIMLDAIAAVEDHNTNDVSISDSSEFNSNDDPILLHAISKLEDQTYSVNNFNSKKRNQYWDKIAQNKKKKCFKIGMGCEDKVCQGSSSYSDTYSE